VSGIALHLRGEVRELFFDWLKDNRPELIARYEQLYRKRAYVPSEEKERLAALVRAPEPMPRRQALGRGVSRQRPTPPGRDQAEQGRLF
jgi:hypothetical protein